MKSVCDACDSGDIYSIYKLERIPAFQNKLFKTRQQAIDSPCAKVDLACCPRCGLIFNADFRNDLMEYDDDYQNAQDHSPSFRAHLEEMADIMTRHIRKSQDKVVEIGCGKAFFFDMLQQRGFDIIGFDPTYEGDNPRITKEYFNRDTAHGLDVHTVIMRHTLEHIERPYDFLRELRSFVPAETEIFIEIPRFEWIAEHKAFWDIFHEHCNYFTEEFFEIVFGGNAEITPVFSGQYMVVRARLGDLVDSLSDAQSGAQYGDVFKDMIPVFAQGVAKYNKNYVWGAGAKGIAFLNILDPGAEKIEGVIDINARKNGHFVPLTGHPCMAPAMVDWQAQGADTCLWIMNDNYAKEILGSIAPYRGAVHILGASHASV